MVLRRTENPGHLSGKWPSKRGEQSRGFYEPLSGWDEKTYAVITLSRNCSQQGLQRHTSHGQHFRVILGPKVLLEDGRHASASGAGPAHVCAPPRLCDAVPIEHQLKALQAGEAMFP